MSDRLKIWKEHRDIAMLVLAHMLDESDEDEGLAEPMVLICDEHDSLGRELTSTLGEIIDRHDDITAVVVGGSDGISVLIVPTEVVRDLMKESNPPCAKALDTRPPEDSMWCAVVAYEGITLLHVPIEPFRAIGSA